MHTDRLCLQKRGHALVNYLVQLFGGLDLHRVDLALERLHVSTEAGVLLCECDSQLVQPVEDRVDAGGVAVEEDGASLQTTRRPRQHRIQHQLQHHLRLPGARLACDLGDSEGIDPAGERQVQVWASSAEESGRANVVGQVSGGHGLRERLHIGRCQYRRAPWRDGRSNMRSFSYTR